MRIKDLKKIIETLPNDMEIFVGCQGYSNFNFESNKPWEYTETLAVVYNGKLFVTDECALDEQ